MTVSSNVPVNNYSGNSSSTRFDFDFLVETSSQLIVQHINSSGVKTVLTEGVDYSINELNNPEGSYITFPLQGSAFSILAPDEKISLALDLVIKQENRFANSLYFDLGNLEKTFDYVVRILQIFSRKIERSIKVVEGSDIDTDNLSQSLNVVAGNVSAVNTVSASISNVNAVAADLTNINAVHADLTNIDTVSGSIANVNAVAGDISNVNSVAADLTNIDAVKNNSANINAVKNGLLDIAAIAAAITNVNTVGNNISDVNLVADNIPAIQDFSLAVDLVNNGKALETGAVSDNATVYNQIRDYYHSTFDLTKFTVTGTPTITDDGIVKGFSGTSEYISLPITNRSLEGKSWSFTVKWINNGETESNFPVLFAFQFYPTQGGLIYNVANKRIVFAGKYGDTNGSTGENLGTGLNLGLSISEISSITTQVSFDISTGTYTTTAMLNDNGVWLTPVTYTPTSTNKQLYSITSAATPTYLFISGRSGAANVVKNDMDLKCVSFVVDGVEVFNGNKQATDTVKINGSDVSITYNLTKQGSKIAPASYRTQITALYEQNGYAPYYTIDEANQTFTLPAGDIYGMLGNLQRFADNEIGLPIATLSNTLNDGEIWLEGAEVSKTTYSKLYAIYGDDYGMPLDNDNFVLPNFTDRVMQAIDSTGTWGYIAAGLPNITGRVTDAANALDFNTATGAFSGLSSSHRGTEGGEYNRGNYGGFSFNASSSNSIYGNANTVQPPAIKVRVKTRYA